MITAIEALQLQSAKLTDEEKAAADKLGSAIDGHIRQFMAYNGVDFKTDETNPRVVAEVNQRLKRAGYNPNWSMLVQQHRLNQANKELVGFQLSLAPSDESYLIATRASLS